MGRLRSTVFLLRKSVRPESFHYPFLVKKVNLHSLYKHTHTHTHTNAHIHTHTYTHKCNVCVNTGHILYLCMISDVIACVHRKNTEMVLIIRDI